MKETYGLKHRLVICAFFGFLTEVVMTDIVMRSALHPPVNEAQRRIVGQGRELTQAPPHL
jgi:hypothetical protein